MNVDKARARDFNLGSGGEVERLDHCACQRPWVQAKALGRAHHTIGLIVTEFWALGIFDDRRRLGRTGLSEGVGNGLVDKELEVHG